MLLPSTPDVDLVRGLLAAQFPVWLQGAIERVHSTGTANALFRLGSDLLVRLPRTDSAARAAEKERVWLPKLAPQLPLAIPVPVADGLPTEEFPFPWLVFPWVEGEDGWARPIEDVGRAGLDLAGFVSALRRVDASQGPPPGEHNCQRGVSLHELDSRVRAAITASGDRVDRGVSEAWDAAVRQPRGTDDVWIHGDLHPGNLLTRNGRLTAVIDFGLLGVGDPACDLLPAWNLLTRETRVAFRAALRVDDATWLRGIGWALYQALLALPYYWDTNPVMVRMSQRVIGEILADREF